MKKIVLTIVALTCAVSMLGALELGIPVSFDIDPVGYMNHTVFTTYEDAEFAGDLGDAFADEFGSGSLTLGDSKSTMPLNCYALGLDLHISYFYLAASFGLPFKLEIQGLDILKPEKYPFESKAGGSVIFDGQLGGAYDVMTLVPELSKSMSLQVGGGLALNMLYAKRPGTKEAMNNFNGSPKLIAAGVKVKDMFDVQKQFSMGLGLNVNFSYYFTKNIGLNVALSDSILFIPIVSERYFSGQLENGRSYTYTLTKDGNKDLKKAGNIKSQFSNNFVARLGLAVKL